MLKTVNPHDSQILAEYKYTTNEELTKIIDNAWAAFERYRDTEAKERSSRLLKLADVMEENVDKYAKAIALEMGKPFEESKGEVQKAAKHARYFAENIDTFLRPDDNIKTSFKKSYVEYRPLGPIFFIAPNNFPFWLVCKGAIPAITMGNTIIFKTASSCVQTGQYLEEAFHLAGFNKGEFTNVVTQQSQSEFIISNKKVRGVSFTGSTQGGETISNLAGRYTKKSIMELGGSDPFVVLEDADVGQAATVAVQSRLRNCGQVCTCAKRFIIHESLYEDFKKKVLEQIPKVKMGNPMNSDTKLGPLANKKTLDSVLKQIEQGVSQGAKLLYGGHRSEEEEFKNGYYMVPAVLEGDDSNVLAQEETFGPIFYLMKFKTDAEALKIANNSDYGLSAMVFSKDEERAYKFGVKIETGAMFVNALSTSDPKLPSGGVKKSGYGRECGINGAREFTNAMAVWIK